MKRNERTKKMMRNYVKLHEMGLSAQEIADKYHLSTTTVYANLGEIAEKAGVTRESLLAKVQPSRYVPGSVHAKTPVLPEGEFRADAAKAMEAIEKVQRSIREDLEQIEAVSEQNKGGISL